MTRKTTILTFAAAALLCAAPWTASAQPRPEPPKFTLVSQAEELQIGRQAFAEIMQKNESKICRDPKLNRRVATLLERLTPYSAAPVRDWEFVVFEDPTPNAFAMPGSKVAVHTGMFKIATDDNMLAAVIGHEIAHVELRHSARRMDAQIGTNLLGALAGSALQNEKHKSLYLNLLGFGSQTGILLPFSRKHELESDQLGLWYMAKAGYDPRAAVTLWARMAKVGGGKPFEFLSTHPADQRRIAEIEAYLPYVMPIYEAAAQ